MSKCQQLYSILYEWFASETCTDCQHMETYVEGDVVIHVQSVIATKSTRFVMR